MIKRVCIAFTLWICFFADNCYAQFDFTASLGLGWSNQRIFFDDSNENLELLKGRPTFSGGINVSRAIPKGGKLSLRFGAELSTSGFKNIPVDRVAFDNKLSMQLINNSIGKLPRDESHPFKVRYWSVNFPFTFLLNAYEGIGLLWGADLNLLFKKEEKHNTMIDKHWINLYPITEKVSYRGRLGIFYLLNDKIEIQSYIFSDIPARLTYRDINEIEVTLSGNRLYREAGIMIQMHYKLN